MEGEVLCNKSNEVVYQYDEFDGDGVSENMAHHVGYLWMVLTLLILVGNLTVLIWRCSRRKEERNSIPSILVINLALGDFLLGLQMLFFLVIFKWPCPVLVQLKLVSMVTLFCDFSQYLEVISLNLSSMLTVTIAFYYVTSVFGRCCCCCGPSSCSRKAIVVILVLEWTLAVGAAAGLKQLLNPSYGNDLLWIVKPEHNGSNVLSDIFSSYICVPMFANFQNFLSLPIVLLVYFLLVLIFVAVTAYISLLVKLRITSRRHPHSNFAAVSGLGLRLIIISFVTAACWIVFVAVPIAFFVTAQSFHYTYYALCVISIVAISNPFVFTLFSKPVYNSARKLWIYLRFKAGRAVPLAEISINDENPLQTNLPGDSDSSFSDE